MELFCANHVYKEFGATKALTDVSISVEKGTIFGLLGPNGAGKTTLIRIINQITAPDKGEVLLEGRPMVREDISKIGYLPEERGLYKKMKIGEQAIYLAQLKGLSRNQAIESLKYWFKKFDITAWWDKKVEELSKGMQQKVQFITTVVHRPSLLIFDEPFSGFDPINANLIKQEILELKEKGATIIFSTHNMSTVEDLCDHIALINKSRKILDGRVSEVRKNFRPNIFKVSYTGDFEKVEAILGGNFTIIEHNEESATNTVKIKHTGETRENELIKLLIDNVHVISFEEVLPTMNDIFITVVESSNAEKQTGHE